MHYAEGLESFEFAAGVVRGSRTLQQTVNPLKYTTARLKGILGREIARTKAFFRGEKLLGREVSLRVDGIDIRADLLTMRRSGQLRVIEAKLGPYSHLTENQARAFPRLRVTGRAEFYGARAHRALGRIGINASSGVTLNDVDLMLETFLGSRAGF
jgi:hypothetical protein